MIPPVVITMGDPAGIGPEVALRALADPALATCPVALIAHRPTIVAVAQRLGVPVPVIIDPTANPDLPVVPGRPDAASGRLAAACIEEATLGCLAGRYAAMVTGPISKTAIHAAGLPFPGHTEWIAERCGVTGETMLMYHDTLAVALATCHQSLASVPSTMTAERLVAVGTQLAAVLRRLRGHEPRLAMCGFNTCAHGQRSRSSDCSALHAPSRSAQPGSLHAATKAPAARWSNSGTAASPAGSGRPSASASPRGVGTQKRAGNTKAKASSRSSPERSG